MFQWDKQENKAINTILLDENVGGKGKCFRTRFLQPGLVKYSFGVCLLEKETIDKFVYEFAGCPVIINHKDVTNSSAKDDRVGVISKVEYNAFDGWYWAEGVIFEQEALDLIDKGYNVSCQYEITEYSSTKGIHNGNEYDKTILNGKPEHLAIVQNPRYENAMIAVNAIEAENEQEFKTDKQGNHFPTDNENFDNGGHCELLNKTVAKKLKGSPVDFKRKKDDPYFYRAELTHNAETYYKQIIKILDSLVGENNHKWENSGISVRFPKEKKESNKKEEIKQLKLFGKNDIIQAISEIKETSMFKSLFKKENKMDREEMKNLFMECLTELTASNAKEELEDIEKKEEVAENKCKNEEPDYKKMYEDLKAECEAKKEKAKNEIEEQKELINSGKVEKSVDYITERKARELGKELF